MSKVHLSAIQAKLSDRKYFVSLKRCRELVIRYQQIGKSLSMENIIEYIIEMQGESDNLIEIDIEGDFNEPDIYYVTKKIAHLIHDKHFIWETIVEHYFTHYATASERDEPDLVVQSIVSNINERRKQDYAEWSRDKPWEDSVKKLMTLKSKEQEKYLLELIEKSKDGFYLVFYTGEQSTELLELLLKTEKCSGMKYVKNQDPDFCFRMLASCKAADVFKSIRNKNELICRFAVEKYSAHAIHDVPTHLQTEEMWINVNAIQPIDLPKQFSQLSTYKKILDRMDGKITHSIICQFWWIVPSHFKAAIATHIRQRWVTDDSYRWNFLSS